MKLQYTKSEFGAEIFDCDFIEGTWYLPGGAMPYFTLSIYTGTVRRIQYTMNNTNIEGYQPPPCYVDWPEGTFDGTVSWVIGHCPDVVSTFSVTPFQLPFQLPFQFPFSSLTYSTYSIFGEKTFFLI
jgi:hypothetical protein